MIMSFLDDMLFWIHGLQDARTLRLLTVIQVSSSRCLLPCATPLPLL
jgi:hypothetical protein